MKKKNVHRINKAFLISFFIISFSLLGYSLFSMYNSNASAIEDGSFIQNMDSDFDIEERNLNISIDILFDNSGLYDLNIKESSITIEVKFLVNTILGDITQNFNISFIIEEVIIEKNTKGNISITAFTDLSHEINVFLDDFSEEDFVEGDIDHNIEFEINKIHYQFGIKFSFLDFEIYGSIDDLEQIGEF